MELELPPDQAERLLWAIRAGKLSSHGVVHARMLDSEDFTDLTLSRKDAAALASEIITGTGPREEFDAQSILEDHPGLAQYGSIVVDLAYEEFVRRVDAGENTDLHEFAGRFHEVFSSLMKVLEVHEYLETHPEEFCGEPAVRWPQEGDEVACFTLVRELGRGGFSRVFLAHEKDLGNREVVVKICKELNVEGAFLGQLDHPHIISVHSVQTHPSSGFVFLCMPYLGSMTLADVLKDVFRFGNVPRGARSILDAIQRANRSQRAQRHGPLADPGQWHWTLRSGSYAEAIIQFGADISDALAYAHRRGILHCDVKPSNILLTMHGRPMLLDFNLAIKEGVRARVVGGTLPYMAPEQLKWLLSGGGESTPQIDHRADIFAFAVTMFESLTGRLPFPAEDLDGDRQAAARCLLEQQRCGRNLRGELERVVSPAIAGLISECLAFDPDDRPRSAEHVAGRLRDYLRPVLRARRWIRLHKAASATVILFLVSAALALGVWYATLP